MIVSTVSRRTVWEVMTISRRRIVQFKFHADFRIYLNIEFVYSHRTFNFNKFFSSETEKEMKDSSDSRCKLSSFYHVFFVLDFDHAIYLGFNIKDDIQLIVWLTWAFCELFCCLLCMFVVGVNLFLFVSKKKKTKNNADNCHEKWTAAFHFSLHDCNLSANN